MVPTTADGTPLCELPRASPADPHAYVKLWRHHAAQPQADRINALAARARRALAAPLRRADLLGVGVRQGPAAARGGPRGLRRDGALGRGRRLDRLAAVRRPTSATPAPPATRASTRTARYPSADFLRRAQPRLRATSSRTSSSTRIGQLGDRAGAADRRGRGAGPACPRASRSPSATSTPTSPRPPRRAVEPGQMVAIMGTSTCHVMNGDRAARGARACAGSSTAASSPGLWGYEAGQSGVGDIFGWFVEHGVPPAYHEAAAAARARRARAPHRAGRRAGRSASTGWSPSTGTAATARCWSTTSCPAWSSARPWPPGPRTSTGRCWRPPPSAPAPSSRRSTTPACRSPSSSSPAAC